MTDPLRVPAGLVLSVLALDELAWSTVADGRPGVPVSVWRLAVLALDAPQGAPTDDQLAAFAGTSPLVEVAHVQTESIAHVVGRIQFTDGDRRASYRRS